MSGPRPARVPSRPVVDHGRRSSTVALQRDPAPTLLAVSHQDGQGETSTGRGRRWAGATISWKVAASSEADPCFKVSAVSVPGEGSFSWKVAMWSLTERLFQGKWGLGVGGRAFFREVATWSLDGVLVSRLVGFCVSGEGLFLGKWLGSPGGGGCFKVNGVWVSGGGHFPGKRLRGASTERLFQG